MSFSLPRELHSILEKMVTKLPYHTEDEMLNDLHTLMSFREGVVQEADRALRVLTPPTAARNASSNTVTDVAAQNDKIDALTAQVQALIAAMGSGTGMQPPVATPSGDGSAPPPVAAPASDVPAAPVSVPSGTGTTAPAITPPVSGSAAAPVAVPSGTGNAAPATPPPPSITPVR